MNSLSEKPNKNNKLEGVTVKELKDNLKKTYGNVNEISKKEISSRYKARQKERSERPDYELGNPFNIRGRSRNVYRPKNK